MWSSEQTWRQSLWSVLEAPWDKQMTLSATDNQVSSLGHWPICPEGSNKETHGLQSWAWLGLCAQSNSWSSRGFWQPHCLSRHLQGIPMQHLDQNVQRTLCCHIHPRPVQIPDDMLVEYHESAIGTYSPGPMIQTVQTLHQSSLHSSIFQPGIPCVG